MNEYYKRLINLIAILVTVAFEAISFGVLWYVYYIPLIDATAHRMFMGRGNMAVVALYTLIMVGLTNAFDGYALSYMRLRDIILSHIPALIFANIFAFFEITLVASVYYSPQPLVQLCLVQIVFVLVWTFITRRLYVRLYPPRKLLLVYGTYPYEDLVKKMCGRKDRYSIESKISLFDGNGMEDVKAAISRYKAVLLVDLPDEERNTLIKYCASNSIRVYVTPKITDILFAGAEEIHLFDTPLFMMRNTGIPVDKLLVKRIFDIVCSLIGCILASPIMLVIALAVKLYDGGPVFYTQERLTRDGVPFKMIKFRSMRVDSEKHGARLAAKNDDRITPVGKIIRRLHLDELPQILNILKGDMSIVGPRPEREVIAKEYEESMPEFGLRLKVKAGLTGYAQVYGQYNTTPYDKLKLDLIYIANYSLLMDIKIILLTVKILFVKENTEGVDSSKTNALR